MSQIRGLGIDIVHIQEFKKKPIAKLSLTTKEWTSKLDLSKDKNAEKIENFCKEINEKNPTSKFD